MPNRPELQRSRPRNGPVSDYGVIETILQYWSAQDIPLTLSLVSNDVVHRLFICGGHQPCRGERVGREAISAMMYDLLADFDYLRFDPVILDVRSGTARVQARFCLRHRATGEILSGSKRFVCTLHRGLLVRVHEYQDGPLLEAFKTLTRSRLAEQSMAPSPNKFARP